MTTMNANLTIGTTRVTVDDPTDARDGQTGIVTHDGATRIRVEFPTAIRGDRSVIVARVSCYLTDGPV